MGAEPRLGAEFFARSVQDVAAGLIGCALVNGDCAGIIVETESYDQDEPACHAHVGLTDRTAVLFGPPGRAYVYLSYGIHSLFNVVAEPEGRGAAVLVRALEPTVGIEAMRARRGGRPDGELCAGPGRLTEALAIGLDSNRVDLSAGPLAIHSRPSDWRGKIVTGPRIGITKATELPWRFSLAGSPFVSRPRPNAVGPGPGATGP